jgi:hypothetical protein
MKACRSLCLSILTALFVISNVARLLKEETTLLSIFVNCMVSRPEMYNGIEHCLSDICSFLDLMLPTFIQDPTCQLSSDCLFTDCIFTSDKGEEHLLHLHVAHRKFVFYTNP